MPVLSGSVPAVVVTGSGALARSICCSLAVAAGHPVAVTVLARSAERAAELAYVAGARARLSRSPATFAALPADPGDAEAIGRALAAVRPAIVLHCVSLQSPWERLVTPSAWTELLRRAGFGATLPLQARLAVTVAGAVAAAAPGALLVNACFPDAVNPLLAGLRLPVHCGIGNVALLAASLQAALGLEDQRGLQVLAHHVHLHAPEVPDEEALAWSAGRAVPDVTALLADQRAAARPKLNAVTGHAAALLARDLLRGDEVWTSLPGPGGRPGGYPVRLRGDRLDLRLPDGLSEADAIAWNQEAALRDGVQVAAGRVTFSAAGQRELRPHVPEVAAGFPVEALNEACNRLLDLRARLRRDPVRTPARGPA